MKIYLSLILALAFTLQVSAQGDPLGGKDKLVLENERIEDVIDSDKPFLKIPYQEIKEGELSKITYESKDLYVETDFEPAPPNPRVLDLNKEFPEHSNFLKAGFGRYATPFAQFYLHGEQSGYDYGVDLSHLSAHNDVIPFREFRENDGHFHVGYLTDQSKFMGHVKFFNTRYYNYADTMSRISPEAYQDSIQMNVTQFELGGQVLRNYETDALYDYDMGASLQFHGDRRNNRELHINLTPNGSYAIGDGIEVGASSAFTFTGATIGGQGQSRIFLDLTPHLKYKTGDFAMNIGLRLNYYNNNADSASRAIAAPQLDLRYQLIPGSLTVFAGVTGGLIYNKYSDLIRENRFLSNDVVIKPTANRAHVYGGISGQLGNKADYNAQVNYKRVEDALIYMVADTGAYFTLGYDSLMNVLGVDIELNYDILEELRAGAKLVYNNYNTSSFAKNFHRAPLELGVYASYTYDKRLTGTAELNIYGTTPMALDREGSIIDRKTFMDLNLGGDFRLSDRLSLWLEVNNLLNATYQRWYNYTERPLDIKGGLTFSF